MARRYYSSTAVATTLSASANNSTTSITVTALSGFPVSTPWTAIIDPDTASEEVVTVTNVSGTTLTVTRGVDGTSAVSHNSGAVFRHGVSARDFDEANSHVNDTSTDVHSQYVLKSLLTNKAALITATAASTPATLAVGTDGQVLKANSATSTGLEWGTDLGIPATLLDAKGDIIAATGDNTAARLAAGTNEHRLVADSAQATGLKYVADTTNYAIGAKGDLLVGTAADTLTNVTVGTNGHVLTADSTADSGVKWAAVSVAAPPNCRVKQSSSTSLTQNVGTVIAFQAEDFDTDTMHDNTSNNSRITIKTAGKYLVGATVQVNANSTIGARLRLNGSTFIGSTIVGNAGNPSAASVATIYDFAVNDYIEVLGLTGNLSTSTSGDGETTAFAIKVA